MPEGTQAITTNEKDPYKSFVSGSERVLRKTTTLEIMERTVPRTRSSINLKGRSTVVRKAMFFMELLWEHGYRKQIDWKTLDFYVEQFLGGFRQTKQFYLGKTKVMGRGVGGKYGFYVPGLLEKLHYVSRVVKGEAVLAELHHEFVPLPYHYVESLNPYVENEHESVNFLGPVEFQHNDSLEGEERPLKKSLSPTERGLSVLKVTTTNDNKQQHTVRERNFQPCESESIWNAENLASGPWLTELEMAQIMKRDRKRLEILDLKLLPFLEKIVKNRGESQP